MYSYTIHIVLIYCMSLNLYACSSDLSPSPSPSLFSDNTRLIIIVVCSVVGGLVVFGILIAITVIFLHILRLVM